MTPRRSAAWTVALRVEYAMLRALDPLIRWMWFSVGIGITSRLTVRGRRTGRERSVLVGLLRVNGAWYVGHPNGEVGWTANLRAARRATIAQRAESPFEVAAVPIGPGPERDAVIRATAEQQPFPGNLVYRAARRHILSEGRYFRLEPA
jgi:deazaflavin-dependent oxidoreductase (nitroreductase family)